MLRAQLAEAARGTDTSILWQPDAGPMQDDHPPPLSELPLVGGLFAGQSDPVDGLGFDWALAARMNANSPSSLEE